MPASLPPPAKRRKNASYSQSIKRLEDDLHDSVTKNDSLNSLADLLELAYTVEDPHDTSKAIYALYRVFVVVISNNKLEFGGDEAAKVVKAWIWERLQSYVDFLASLLQDEEKFLRVRKCSFIVKMSG
jgi:U3 small nucleolar RNA-associated protein 19